MKNQLLKNFTLVLYLLIIISLISGCTSNSDMVREAELESEYLTDKEVQERAVLDWDQFVSSNHELGRSWVTPENVIYDEENLILKSPDNSYNGAQQRTKDRVGYGSYIIKLKLDNAPGSLTAFFLYQGVEKKNDEIDIEIYNDDSRKIDFVVWKDGERKYYEQKKLDFDPTSDYFEYRIDYYPEYINFYVEDELMATFKGESPQSEMYLLANHWWPTWLEASLKNQESKNYIKSFEFLI